MKGVDFIMQNEPTQTGNPSLPVDAEAAQNTKDELAEGEMPKSEEEKEKETAPGDAESFDVDKVDDLEQSKKRDKKY